MIEILNLGDYCYAPSPRGIMRVPRSWPHEQKWSLERTEAVNLRRRGHRGGLQRGLCHPTPVACLESLPSILGKQQLFKVYKRYIRRRTMLQNLVHPQEQLPVEDISSPLGAHILEFCESELFPETLQNSEVASSSNCCYEEHSSYPAHLSINTDMSNFTNNIDLTLQHDMKPVAAAPSTTSPSEPTVTSTITPTTNKNNSNFSIIFDSAEDIENDISASIDFTPSPTFSVPQYFNNNNNQENFDFSSLNNQISVGDVVDGSLSHYPHEPPPPVPLLGLPLPPAYDEECLSSIPSYMRLRTSSPSCTIMDPMIGQYLPAGNMNPPFSAENSGILTGGGLLMGTELPSQELDFQGDNGGLFLPDTISRLFNCSSDLQALSNESQQMSHGGPNSTPLASEISSLEDSTFKVGKLSVEERKKKIHRYMKKRNERNFSKKIKYACRKTLADSRPRVRGRFAKNDELGEAARTAGSNHEEDTDEDVSLFANQIPHHQGKVVVKEEDMVDSSDIFAHISGVNSFKCNYPIQSWI
ncbi:CCT motif family protein [Abeliophyllum distichum]|uniref:CCT motif family protein n=1 Tax=Abeliophyllum distichum TaxID=126358 RepID=A0ABD1Q0F0_9LAMI